VKKLEQRGGIGLLWGICSDEIFLCCDLLLIFGMGISKRMVFGVIVCFLEEFDMMNIR
jgi:hypothetical protein